jgi:hypothetical protein
VPREEDHCEEPYENFEEPIIPSLVSTNLDYSQDFSIFPFAYEDSIDDVFPPKNEDDKKNYALVQPKSQEYDTNPKGKALAKIFTEGSGKDSGLHKNDQPNNDEWYPGVMYCSQDISDFDHSINHERIF